MSIRKVIIQLLLMSPAIFINQALAQLNPVTATYYQNQYLANPAMAGFEKGIIADINYRQQWSSVPGAPATQTMTTEYGSKKVGLGVNIYNDIAGLLKRTRVMASYSYHLPLNDDSRKLNFGISLGLMSERLENSEVKGDDGDIAVGRYNYRASYLDADFGIAYTDKKLTIQTALPNMKAAMNKDDIRTVDRSTFFSAVSYRLYYPDLLEGLTLEPKISYRGVKGQDNISDIGLRMGFIENSINAIMMYHSNQSATFGIGMNYRAVWGINTMYTTPNAALNSYTSGSFEIGLRMLLQPL